MNLAPQALDPQAEIASAEALTLWLADRGLAALSAPLLAQGFWGTALLDADTRRLDELAGVHMERLQRLLAPVHRFRAGLPPALTRAELEAELLVTWPGPIAHEIRALGSLLERGKTVGAPWQELVLLIAGGRDEIPLIGAGSLVAHHASVAPGKLQGHREEAAPLFLRRGSTRLTLGPLLAARRCTLCGYRDVFFFNGWDRSNQRFDLLDHQIGHRMRQPWHQVPDFHAEALRLPTARQTR